MVTDTKNKILQNGELIVSGRLVDASNATLFGNVSLGAQKLSCIYKPIRGERPLWDFPDGALAHREYVAYLVSAQFGFDCVPLTILRDGPFGIGMVQEWIAIDESIDLASYFSKDLPQLRSMALFDVIINNTDRKIGHLLPDLTGKLFGCDHGVTFHEDFKLRTVLWQWAGEKLSSHEVDLLKRGAIDLQSDFAEKLAAYLSQVEIQAMRLRIDNLLIQARFPLPNPDWPAVPWPAF